MAAKDRIDMICKESGFSEEIVRKVLSAETKVAVNEMKKGNSFLLSERVKLIPYRVYKMVNGDLKPVIKIRAQVLKSIESKFDGIDQFICENKSDEQLEREMRELVLNSIGSEDTGHSVVMIEEQIGELL